ncbi:MAG: RDD family protein [Acholeplasmatales bacterium]|jgi:uncharacterized RDD family membrane protein YckC|nr:RDD family protein [Acholeplasmatales bacterium]
MVEATPLQRFLAYFIDMLILVLITTIFQRIMQNVIVFPQMTEEIINSMPANVLEVYNKSNGDLSIFIQSVYLDMNTQADFTKWLNAEPALGFFDSYYSAALNLTLSVTGFYLVLDFLYRGVLAYFWQGQTVGRFLTRTKVVNKLNTKPTFGQFVLRDFVGSDIISVLNCCLGIIFILNIVFIFTRNKTIGDMFANTVYVRYDAKADEIKNEFEHMKEMNERFNENENPYAPPRSQVYTPDDDSETNIVVDIDDKDE